MDDKHGNAGRFKIKIATHHNDLGDSHICCDSSEFWNVPESLQKSDEAKTPIPARLTYDCRESCSSGSHTIRCVVDDKQQLRYHKNQPPVLSLRKPMHHISRCCYACDCNGAVWDQRADQDCCCPVDMRSFIETPFPRPGGKAMLRLKHRMYVHLLIFMNFGHIYEQTRESWRP